MTRTEALGKLYKKITGEDMPIGANTTTEALQKVYEALTNDTAHHINVTEIIDDLATNWDSGGGGGGSSDFSTAKLTYSGVEQIYISRIYAKGDNISVTPIIADSGTYDVVLYNGVAYGDLDRVLGNVSVDGAIEYDDGGVIITGDCTITIS